MTAIETTAVLESGNRLRLTHALPPAAHGTLRLIVLLPETTDAVVTAPDFENALGSYYREHPLEPRRTSDEWLHELREGEAD